MSKLLRAQVASPGHSELVASGVDARELTFSLRNGCRSATGPALAAPQATASTAVPAAPVRTRSAESVWLSVARMHAQP